MSPSIPVLPVIAVIDIAVPRWAIREQSRDDAAAPLTPDQAVSMAFDDDVVIERSSRMAGIY